MANYSFRAVKATAATAVGMGTVYCPGSGQRRFKLLYMSFGSDTAPADNALRFEVQRSTTAATSTAVVPNPLDPADIACVTLAGENLTVQGTNTAATIVLSLPCNQKATVQWYAPLGAEPTAPATASNGFHFNTPTAGGTPQVVAECYFAEL